MAMAPKTTQREIIGIIPAAGQATRLAPLPCSKELYPVGLKQGGRPKVICEYLLDRMRQAGIRKVYIVLRHGKWDIPAHFGDGTTLDMHIAYLMMNLPFGVPYTLDQAYPFVRDSLVALGFPDILFSADHAFEQLLAQQVESDADVVLGLFPARRPQKVDMVDFGPDRKVREIVIKPQKTSLRYAWAIAVWTPTFTHFMHQYLADAKAGAADAPELFVGDVVQAAIDRGLRVEAVQVSEDPFLDIGTPDDLAKAAEYLRGM